MSIKLDLKIFPIKFNNTMGNIFLSNEGEAGADESEPAVRGVSLETLGKSLNSFLLSSIQ